MHVLAKFGQNELNMSWWRFQTIFFLPSNVWSV